MAYHFIAIASYYIGGYRIGWHYSSENILDKDVVSDFLNLSQKVLGKAEFGIHKLTTNSTEWSSVVEKDSFFKDVIIIKDKEHFFSMLEKDAETTAFDIAKFFLSLGSLTNLKLQKLVYLAYAVHMERTGSKLFKEPIIAYQYGPVIEDVYRLYKGNGRNNISADDEVKIQLRDITVPLPLAKIALNKDSFEILKSLEITLNKYWEKSASELVRITHTPGGPWDRVYKKEPFYGVIDDNLIKKYHCVEC